MSLEPLFELLECLHKGRVTLETRDWVCAEGHAAFCTCQMAEAGEFELYLWRRFLGVKVKHGEEVEQLLS